MSSEEKESYMLHSPKLDEDTLKYIKDYESVDADGAKKLRMQSHLYRTKGKEREFVGYRYAGFKDQSIDELVAKFNDWRTKQYNTAVAHNEYIKMSQDRPGRGATILTPMSGPSTKTVLGDGGPYGGTVLG